LHNTKPKLLKTRKKLPNQTRRKLPNHRKPLRTQNSHKSPTPNDVPGKIRLLSKSPTHNELPGTISLLSKSPTHNELPGTISLLSKSQIPNELPVNRSLLSRPKRDRPNTSDFILTKKNRDINHQSGI